MLFPTITVLSPLSPDHIVTLIPVAVAGRLQVSISVDPGNGAFTDAAKRFARPDLKVIVVLTQFDLRLVFGVLGVLASIGLSYRAAFKSACTFSKPNGEAAIVFSPEDVGSTVSSDVAGVLDLPTGGDRRNSSRRKPCSVECRW